MELEERLDEMECRIRRLAEQEEAGAAGGQDYWIFDYPPEQELQVRERIAHMQAKNAKGNDPFVLAVYDLYDLIIDFLEQEGYLETCISLEKDYGLHTVVEAVSSAMQFAEQQGVIIQKILSSTPEHAVVFLTGIGKCYPLLRSHNILNGLFMVFRRAPVVLFFPGTYTGQEFILFNEIKDGNYYRAYPLVGTGT